MERSKVSRNADERTTLLEMLDFYRATILLKSAGLDHDQLNQALAPSSLTLAGLLKHLAAVEDTWIIERFLAQPVPEPWLSAPWDTDEDWDFNSASADSPEDLRALYEKAAARTNAAIDGVPLDTLAPEPYYSGSPWTLRWVLLHLVEETARHAGHADLIREAIDGSVGV